MVVITVTRVAEVVSLIALYNNITLLPYIYIYIYIYIPYFVSTCFTVYIFMLDVLLAYFL